MLAKIQVLSLVWHAHSKGRCEWSFLGSNQTEPASMVLRWLSLEVAAMFKGHEGVDIRP